MQFPEENQRDIRRSATSKRQRVTDLQDDSTLPSATRLWLGMLARLAAVLALAAIVDFSGFADAGDGWLRTRYYELRGQRASSQRVVLVGLDAPVSQERMTAILERIERGKPVAIGAVDDAARLLTVGKLPKQVVSGKTELPISASIESAPLATAAGPTVIAQLANAAGFAPGGREVAINYVGERGLPIVSASQVANGEIPVEAFAGKLVVLGLTADAYGVVPTPIGPLAPAKVQAHALATITDRAALPMVPSWLRWLALVVACTGAMLIARSIATLGASIANTAIVVGVVVLDYGLFAGALGRMGATLPVMALFAAASIERIYERMALRRHVRELGYWARQWMALDSMRGNEVSDDDPGYWDRVDTLAKLYLGCTSTILAELPAGAHRLHTTVLGHSDVAISERRMDVRRSPYRKAHLTLAPVWHDKYVFGNAPSLIVPLSVRGKLIGFWIITFQSREQVEGPHLALIKTLAQEIAMAIDRRRMRVEASRDIMAIAAGRMSLELGDIRRAYRSRIQTQRDLLALGDSLPFGVFVSTLWGEIRYMNTAMKQVCQSEGVDPASASSGLPDVLSKLTGFKHNEVHEHLRSLVQELEELHVRGRDRMDRPGRDFVLSWLQPADGDPDGEQMILVCAMPQRMAERRPAADDHSATVPVMKMDLDGLSQTSVRMLARGTPTFTNGVPSLPLPLPLPANPAVGGKPLIPDATLHLRKSAVAAGTITTSNGEDFYDEVTMIAAGNGRAQRTLPVIKQKIEMTMPMFKMGPGES